MNIIIDGSGYTLFMGQKIPYTFGKNGISEHKIEGDKTTPTGFHRPVALFYRAGRIVPPKTFLPTFPLYVNDGWCDDVSDSMYNHFIKHPYRADGEHLWRNDELYDLILVTDYNYPNATKGAGSAIFIHVMSHAGKPTQGCVAFKIHHLKRIITALRQGDGFMVI